MQKSYFRIEAIVLALLAAARGYSLRPYSLHPRTQGGPHVLDEETDENRKECCGSSRERGRSHGPATGEGRERTPIADLAPITPRATLTVTMEDSNGCQDGRITHLLLEVKRRAGQMKTL